MSVLESSTARFTAEASFPVEADRAQIDAGASAAKRFLLAVPYWTDPVITITSLQAGGAVTLDRGTRAGTAPQAVPVRIVSRATAGDLDVAVVEVASVVAVPGAPGAPYAVAVRSVGFTVVFGPAGLVATRGRASERGERTVGAGAEARPESPMERVFRRVLLNPDQIDAFRRPAALAANPPEAESFVPTGCSDCVKIIVDQDGMYRINMFQLQSAGLSLSGVAPDDLVLYHDGEETPLLVEDGGDGRLDSTDALVFFGERNRARWTDDTCYWLKPSGGPGRPIREVSGGLDEARDYPGHASFTRTLRIEENDAFWAECPGGDSVDPWFFGYQATNGHSTSVDSVVAYPERGFDEPRLAAPDAGRTYWLTSHFISKTGGGLVDEIVLDVEVNGHVLGTARWFGIDGRDRTVRLPFDPAVLTRSGNQITVRLYRHDETPWYKSRIAYVDWFDVEVPCALAADGGVLDFEGDYGKGGRFHAGNFASPRAEIYRVNSLGVSRIESYAASTLGPGFPYTLVFAAAPEVGPDKAAVHDRFLVYEDGRLPTPKSIMKDTPSSLRQAQQGASYVVIAHPNFIAEAREIAAYRAPSFASMAVGIEDIYDEFSHGNVDSSAMRDFLAYAADYWTVPPQYVLLVGDTSFDYKNFRRVNEPSYAVPSYVPSREFYLRSIRDRRAISDQWFACVKGNDFLPDMFIGRITARQAGETRSVLDKMVEYDAALSQDWMKRIELVADDDDAYCGQPGPFADTFEALVAQYQPETGVWKRYFGTYPDKEAARSTLIQDLSQGVALSLYFGHGSDIGYGRHCSDATDDVLGRGQLQSIVNPGRYPIGVAATCNVGEFDVAQMYYQGRPEQEFVTDSMAEQYVKAPGQGMVAYIATTTALLQSLGVNLSEGVFKAFFDGPGIPDLTLGEVAFEAILRHYQDFAGDPTRNIEDARDGILSLAVLGDPALAIRIEAQ